MKQFLVSDLKKIFKNLNFSVSFYLTHLIFVKHITLTYLDITH